MDEVIQWLLEGDSAVRFQTLRDLLDDQHDSLQTAIPSDGDAATLLAARTPEGHWGRGFYQPKWTCSHYVLLELRGLGLPRSNPLAGATVELILDGSRAADGGVNPSGRDKPSDVCINGMFLNYASWFRPAGAGFDPVVDFLLSEAMPDGGYNCQRNRSGAHTASVHTTLSVLEGFTSYLAAGAGHRRDDVRLARDAAIECLLSRQLFRSRRTGEPIRQEFTRLHHPARWHFDVLRALDALREAEWPYDPRMDPALEVVHGRRRADGRWAASRGYAGETHLGYPTPGQPGRWVTLQARRVLRAYP